MRELQQNRDHSSTFFKEIPGTSVQYPYLYFAAQVRFAQKWAMLTEASFQESLNVNTDLYRRIVNNPMTDEESGWKARTGSYSKEGDMEKVTNDLFSAYLNTSLVTYSPPDQTENYFNGPYYVYYPQAKIVGRHFTPPNRTDKSLLSSSRYHELFGNMRMMYQSIHDKHPEAEIIQGESWLLSHPHYQSLLPAQAIADSSVLDESSLTFRSDSLWGQFLNAKGEGHEANYANFITSLDKAMTIEEALRAFPFQVKKGESPVQVYYKHYQIDF